MKETEKNHRHIVRFFQPKILFDGKPKANLPALMLAYFLVTDEEHYKKDHLVELLYDENSQPNARTFGQNVLYNVKKLTTAVKNLGTDGVLCDLNMFETDIIHFKNAWQDIDELWNNIATPLQKRKITQAVEMYQTDFLQDINRDSLSNNLFEWIANTRDVYSLQYQQLLEMLIRQNILYRHNKQILHFINKLKAYGEDKGDVNAICCALVYKIWFASQQGDYQLSREDYASLLHELSISYDEIIHPLLIDNPQLRDWEGFIINNQPLPVELIDLSAYHDQDFITPHLPDDHPQYHQVTLDVTKHLLENHPSAILTGYVGCEFEIIYHSIADLLEILERTSSVKIVLWKDEYQKLTWDDILLTSIDKLVWKGLSILDKSKYIKDYFDATPTLVIIHIPHHYRYEDYLPHFDDLASKYTGLYSILCCYAQQTDLEDAFPVETHSISWVKEFIISVRPQAQKKQWMRLPNNYYEQLLALFDKHGMGLALRILYGYLYQNVDSPEYIIEKYQDAISEWSDYTYSALISIIQLIWMNKYNAHVLQNILLIIFDINPNDSTPIELIKFILVDTEESAIEEVLSNLVEIKLCQRTNEGYQLSSIIRPILKYFVDSKKVVYRMRAKETFKGNIINFVCSTYYAPHVASMMKNTILNVFDNTASSQATMANEHFMKAFNIVLPDMIKQGNFALWQPILTNLLSDENSSNLSLNDNLTIRLYSSRIYEKLGDYQAAIRVLPSDIIPQQIDKKKLARLYLQYGIIHLQMQDYLNAKSYLLKGLEHVIDDDRLTLQANLATCYYRQEEYEAALATFRTCERLAQKLKKVRIEIFAINGQAAISIAQLSYRDAQRLYRRSGRYEAEMDKSERCRYYIGRAETSYHLEQWEQSQSEILTAIAIAEQIQYQDLLARSYWLYARVLVASHQYAEGEGYFKRALHYAYQIDNPYLQAGLWNDMGKFYLYVRNVSYAERDFLRALELSIEHQYDQNMAYAIYGLCLVRLDELSPITTHFDSQYLHDILDEYLKRIIAIDRLQSLNLITKWLEIAERHLHHAMPNFPLMTQYPITPILEKIVSN